MRQCGCGPPHSILHEGVQKAEEFARPSNIFQPRFQTNTHWGVEMWAPDGDGRGFAVHPNCRTRVQPLPLVGAGFKPALGDEVGNAQRPMSQAPVECEKIPDMNVPTGICLLSCVGQKLASPSPARDLYTSSWFIKARAYADKTGQPWFVLSAKYGLVHPDDVIAPYDLTLNKMPVAARRVWARNVFAQLIPHLEDAGSVTVLAGRRYREFLEPKLRSRGLDVAVPMERLRIGEQLGWLTRQLNG